MSLDIRKEIMICEKMQEYIEKTQKLTGNSEASIIRVAILEYCKKQLKDTQ